ncbi:FAD-dependent oxidoreductase, partial [Nocardioides marmoraquaticus]
MTEVDVVVVGGGVAGLSVAAALAGRRRVLVVSQGPGSTRWAQGGIAAAVGPGDTPEQHAADTLEAGAGACDPEAVARLTEGGPAAIVALVAAGARLDHHDGVPALGREGGHRRRRVLHASGDATGAEVARALEEHARRL